MRKIKRAGIVITVTIVLFSIWSRPWEVKASDDDLIAGDCVIDVNGDLQSIGGMIELVASVTYGFVSCNVIETTEIIEKTIDAILDYAEEDAYRRLHEREDYEDSKIGPSGESVRR